MKNSALSLKLNQCCNEVIFDHSFHAMLKKRSKINWKWLIAMVVGGWAVLDLPPILFIKLELYCERFAFLHNSKMLFHKISVDLILRFPSLTRLSQRGSQSSFLFWKRYISCWLKCHFLEYFPFFNNILITKSLPGTFIRPGSPFQNTLYWSTL